MHVGHSLRFGPAARSRQHGQAALITVLLLIVGAAAIVYTLATPGKISIENDRKTTAALAQARDALIGRAAADANRPGSLPCPDTDNDGSAESPVAFGGVCPSYIGRLPWKTLNLPDLRDGSGERLWYALSPTFRDHSSGGTLNSDMPGQFSITGTASAAGVVTVIFAPGATLGSQVRDAANQNVAANYLEGGNETGIATSTFVSGQTTATFNDRLLPITSDTLFSVVEMRVLREMRNALRSYRSAKLYFPGANSYADGTYSCDYLTYQGRLPINVSLGCAALADWNPATELPAWFGANNWQNVTYYAVSPCQIGIGAILLAPLTALCAAIGQLSVDGSPADAIVFTAGSGIPALGQARPCNNVSACLDDAENTNADKIFVSPAPSAINNDRILVVWP